MTNHRRTGLGVGLLILGLSLSPSCRAVAQACTSTLSVDERQQVIDSALRALDEAYVIPETAARMQWAIRWHQLSGDYRAISDPGELASVLTRDLRRVRNDKHLAIRYSANVLPPSGGAAPPSSTPPIEPVSLAEVSRFGFARLEKLSGNIGYVDLRRFTPDPAVAGAVASVMNFLTSSDAVIFDLRQNLGGEPRTGELISSYLFDEDPVHLLDFYNRAGNLTVSSWTLPVVSGMRLTHQNVYILTSAQTISGGEAFAYTLKHLQRAKVVGETTAGAAHTVEPRRLGDHFVMSLPTGRPVDPITQTNWEGVGVAPDVDVPAYNALLTAHELALRDLGRALPGEQLGLPGGERWLHAVEPPAAPTPAASFRGDFETGELSQWTSVGVGSGDWFVYTNGNVPPDPGQSDPNIPFDVPQPPEGHFAAIADENGPGTFVLYQDIALDRPYVLHAMVFYESAGTLTNQHVLGPLDEPNQLYRIDLLTPSAPIDTLAEQGLIINVFHTEACGPMRLAPMHVSLDLSPWTGRTVRLRLAASGNAGPLRAGVDDIRLVPR